MGKGLKHNLLGKRFGAWKVVGPDKVVKRNRHWFCVCTKCNTKHLVKQQYLISATSLQCQDCARKPRGYKVDLPHAVWNTLLSNAKKRGIKVKVTRGYAEGLLQTQGFKCALSGQEIRCRVNGTSLGCSQATASLDRIDSRYGYIRHNLQWVHKHINIMKNTLHNNEFIRLCNLVVTNGKMLTIKDLGHPTKPRKRTVIKGVT